VSGQQGVAAQIEIIVLGADLTHAKHVLPHRRDDALKIGRNFVASVAEEVGGSDVVVRSTVALAHSLGLRVIAEGIETPEQLRRLRELGCEYGQGFLFSRPLAPDDLETLLAGWSPAQVAALRSRRGWDCIETPRREQCSSAEGAQHCPGRKGSWFTIGTGP